MYISFLLQYLCFGTVTRVFGGVRLSSRFSVGNISFAISNACFMSSSVGGFCCCVWEPPTLSRASRAALKIPFGYLRSTMGFIEPFHCTLSRRICCRERFRGLRETACSCMVWTSASTHFPSGSTTRQYFPAYNVRWLM